MGVGLQETRHQLTESSISHSMLQVQGISNAATPPPRYCTLSPPVLLSACLVLLGAGGSLLVRLYFVHGGQRLWLSTMIQVSGWPLLLPPLLCVSLLLRSHRNIAGGTADDDHLLPRRLAGAVAVLGAFFAVACFLYSLGSQALPLSTSSLLQATQITFTAVSAFLFAGLRFTPFSVNAVFLLTVGPAILGVVPSSGKTAGEGSSAAYWWTGFFEAMASAALLGLVLPLVEVAMSKYGRRSGRAAGRVTPSYATVMQIQVVMGAAGTVVCLVGMAIAEDFQAMSREAAMFGLGETNYYLVLISGAALWQLSNLGIMGLIVCSSPLLAGIMIALVLPLSELLAVVFLHEKFDGVKGLALVLSLWGFVSYLYGEGVHKKKVTVGNEDLESISCPLIATR